MAEVLLAGVTHYPPMRFPDENMAYLLRRILDDSDSTEADWPAGMVEEYGEDGGTTSAAAHRAHLVEDFRRVRRAIDDFAPEVVVLIGDDQYENFRETLVPPFCVFAYEDVTVHPWRTAKLPNVWDEGAETPMTVRGARETGRGLVEGLLGRHFDMAYSYELRDPAVFPHAFLYGLMYLDYDRRGFDYPVLPLAVNCYGRKVISHRGGLLTRAEAARVTLDPPSPTPGRCIELGRAVAAELAAGEQRVAIVASSGWSHAFLVEANDRLYPDIPADQRLYDALVAGDWSVWESYSTDEIEKAGQQEVLNWFCLVGAAIELGQTVEWSDFVTTYCFNSNKTFAIFG